MLLLTHACACPLVLSELSDSTVVTSRAVSGVPRGACRPPAADTQPDSGEHAAGLVQPEQGGELSDMMTARHMSIKER